MAVLWQNLPALGAGPRGHILRKKNVQVLHQQNLNSISEPLGPEQAQTQGLGQSAEFRRRRYSKTSVRGEIRPKIGIFWY